MHEGELPIDVDLVSGLLQEQLPALAGLPLRPVPSPATVNAVFRLGDGYCVRLPRLAAWAGDVPREHRWLPRLAPVLPLQVPEPVHLGRPGTGYPLPWIVHRWIDGEPYREATVADETAAATALAGFVRALHALPTADGAPARGRRPLAELDAATREVAAAAAATVPLDLAAVLATWDDALAAEPWRGPPVWIHTDLLPTNLLIRDGVLRGVIDFGGVGVGDPAADLIPAWTVFERPGREAFRRLVQGSPGADPDGWRRARGTALHQALMIIPYYQRSNPDLVDVARRTVSRILGDT